MTTIIVAVANHKGGVGKTTSTLALGAALAEQGQRVLVVDLDPQGSLTTAAGTPAAHMAATGGLASALQHYIAEGDIRPLAPLTYALAPGLAILPTDRKLRSVELTLAGVMGRERVLATHLSTLTGEDGHDLYDVILIDCPPGQGLLVINAVAAATHVVIPVAPEEMAVDGMKLFLLTLAEARRAGFSSDLVISGVVLTMVDETQTDARVQIAEIRATVEPRGVAILGSVPERVAVKKAATAHQSILAYAPKSDVANAYRAVATALLTAWGGVA